MTTRAARALAAGLAAWLLLPAAALGAPGDLERAAEERRRLEAQLGQVTAELDDIQTRIDTATAERAQLEIEVERLTREAAQATAALETRAVFAYVHASGSPLNQLLDAGGPAAAIERARMLGSIGHTEREIVERAAAARVQLRQRRAELEGVLDQLAADEARVAELRAELAATFEQARAREAELISRRARQRTVSRAGMNGTYACPMGSPFHFRDTWGAPRSGGRRHKGVDIFAPMGTPVYAMTHGVVARHSQSRLGGIGLYLTGDDGNLYYYAHLQRVADGYGPGRRVEAGELIAYNGDSGNARGGAPHLHLEVRTSAGVVNPYPFAAAACY